MLPAALPSCTPSLCHPSFIPSGNSLLEDGKPDFVAGSGMITFNHYPVPGTLTIKGITGEIQITPLFSLVPISAEQSGEGRDWDAHGQFWALCTERAWVEAQNSHLPEFRSPSSEWTASPRPRFPWHSEHTLKLPGFSFSRSSAQPGSRSATAGAANPAPAKLCCPGPAEGELGNSQFIGSLKF